MRQPVFVDTGGWYALQAPNDRWHSQSTKAFRALITAKVRLFTSNLVVGETFTLLLSRHGSAKAWSFHDVMIRSAGLEILRVTDQVEDAAWTFMRRYEDQSFSFVDGTSFALMRQKRLTRALAFDAHFAAAGFSRVPLDEVP